MTKDMKTIYYFKYDKKLHILILKKSVNHNYGFRHSPNKRFIESLKNLLKAQIRDLNKALVKGLNKY